MKAAIAYTRVSTSKQGKSGLGLEAQQEALARFAEAESYKFVETFTEIETGKGAGRARQASAARCSAEAGQNTTPRSSSQNSTVSAVTFTSSAA